MGSHPLCLSNKVAQNLLTRKRALIPLTPSFIQRQICRSSERASRTFGLAFGLVTTTTQHHKFLLASEKKSSQEAQRAGRVSHMFFLINRTEAAVKSPYYSGTKGVISPGKACSFYLITSGGPIRMRSAPKTCCGRMGGKTSLIANLANYSVFQVL